MIVLTVIGFMFFLVPGIILYLVMLRKFLRFHNIVVTASPIAGGTDVIITHPSWASSLVKRFLTALPPFEG
jgi:hypothetical protein